MFGSEGDSDMLDWTGTVSGRVRICVSIKSVDSLLRRLLGLSHRESIIIFLLETTGQSIGMDGKRLDKCD
ncbi:unnamed protein product [Boreogadus saida]